MCVHTLESHWSCTLLKTWRGSSITELLSTAILTPQTPIHHGNIVQRPGRCCHHVSSIEFKKPSIDAKELFRLSECCSCLTNLLCSTIAPFLIFSYWVDWHTLHLKLCLLAGSSNSHDWDMGSFFHTILKFVYFITCSEKLKPSILC